ncbi:MAG: glycine C-acetyltransferase [Thermoanaerobaculia bacterium]
MTTLFDHLAGEMAKLRQAGTFKEELALQSAQGPRVKVGGREVVMLTSNNYLGFANHPRVREAQKKAVDRWGAGLGSVRFICGTQELHKELEAEIASFFGTEDSILHMTCWAANEGLFAAVLDEPDGLYSDELNHASIIDGVRLSKAKRFRVPHNDLAALDRMLAEDRVSRFRLFITDGVFSMEGEEADLREAARVCEKHGAVLAVDDSHATGVLGPTGRGTAEEQGVLDRIPVTTGTLGKAMGSAAGGFVTGPRALVETLRQRSRTYLFSNSLPPAVAAGALEAFRMLREDPAPVRKLRENAMYYRKAIAEAGFTIPHGTHPIVPVIVGDTAKALAMGKALFEEGVYVSGFGFPVVPQGQARLRCQVSAAHERADLDKAVDAFRKVGKAFGVISGR